MNTTEKDQQNNTSNLNPVGDALLEQYKLFASISDGSSDAIYVKDVSGRYLLFNREASRVVGKKAEDVLGKDDFSIFPSKEAEAIIEDDRKIIASKMNSTFEEVVTTVDGITTYLSTKGPIFSSEGKVVGVFGIARDITERKRAEETLRRSKDQLLVAQNNAQIGSWYYDIASDRVDWSPEMFRVFGVDPGRGHLSWDEHRPFIHLDDWERVNKIVTAAMREGIPYEIEFRICHDGKCDKWALSKSTVVRNVQGAITALHGTVQDITVRKRTEDALHRTQNLESLGLLAGGIAHDFNNLLGGIYGYMDLAGELANDPKLRQYISKAMDTIDRGRHLTQQLLTFAKGGAPIKTVTVLYPLVHDTTQFALSGSNVSCTFDFAEDLHRCDIDKNQIAQVIDNIIINAKQAMPDGGNIAVSARNVTFDNGQHASLGQGDYVQIAIRDHGIGMPKEILPRIFDPFYTTKATGHGLGLATCFSIIRRHGGCIDVESEPGKGCTFHVFLPVTAAELGISVVKSKGKHEGTGTFIVMDDEEVMRETIGSMLESFGYRAICSKDGQEAIDVLTAEIAAKNKIAGLIVDLTIPGAMGGKEAIKEIRKINVTIPVFVASGYADDPVMANPTEYGFNGKICKPFRKAEFAELLTRHMKNAK